MSEQVNPFLALDEVKESYRRYIETFQRFRNPEIEQWVQDQIEQGTVLWQQPLIELNRRYQEGKTLQNLVDQGILEQKILEIFTNPVGNPITPYTHQSQAIIKLVKEKQNIIVATGTGSGKSYCYGIPIVNECLKLKKQGKEGIKAVIVYPMNALANSQYEHFSRLIEGTGLTIGKYTGDTPNTKEEALEQQRGEDPRDSEILSREQMRETPSDILMTNYVMLDLLLTRFEDGDLFPENKKGLLKFLVLDEMHTYTGHRGADVACLIRRVKERTGTKKELLCIGTSATIESQTEETASEVISEIGTELFGEPFKPENVIQETYKPQKEIKNPLPLPNKIEIKNKDIHEFDGTFEKTKPLAKSLLGRTLTESNPEELGTTLLAHPAIGYIQKETAEKPQFLHELAKGYHEKCRTNSTLKEAHTELEVAILVGSVATNENRAIIIPKLHNFFSKGNKINSCLTEEGPHLNEKGDLECKECKTQGNTRISFPLAFCRACGQELYGVSRQEDDTLLPRSMDETMDGFDAYLTPFNKETEELEIPENWYQGIDKIRKTYEDAIPETASYCPECNKLNPHCDCDSKILVWVIPKPFQLCPACGVSYTKRPREYNKLFEFSSVGRCTATDIITAYYAMKKKTWTPPKYHRIPKIPWIPQEKQVNQLIAAIPGKYKPYLQILKETGMRPGEAWQLRWKDIDYNTKQVRITPEKGSNPRILPISNELIAMLNLLQKKHRTRLQKREIQTL